MVNKLIVLLLLLGLGVIFTSLVVGFAPPQSLNVTSQYYAQNTVAETGAANIVTAIVVTYRGLDTLGEVTVLFLTATILGLVLSLGHARAQGAQRGTAVVVGELLTTGTRLLIPLILLLGVYVFVNGHLTPGGGFQGGAIMASAALLALLSDPLKPFSHALISAVESTSGLLYVIIGTLGIFLAGGFLDSRLLPLGELGALCSAGAIPLIYTLVGLKVGTEFTSMLVHLSESGES
ncbi:MAG: sodium:proton antiporter [Magnetococcus sp. WYHC-3]